MQQINTVQSVLRFSDFDREFGRFLLRSSGSSSRLLYYTGVLVSFELRSGRTSLLLERYGGMKIYFGENEEFFLPEPADWQAEFRQEQFSSVISHEYLENDTAPLLFIRPGEIMFRRYAELGALVREELMRRRVFAPEEIILPEMSGEEADLQDLAVFVALNSRLLILSGGPGTGKTTVCGRILEELLSRNLKMNILFAAPTGKAQQRLAGQIKSSAEKLPESSPVRSVMTSLRGATLHSFVYNHELRRELEFCDLLLLDECSMIPLEMFAAILKLLPKHAALILTGDRKQLSAVESGCGYGELCCFGKVNQLPETAAAVFNAHGGKVESFSAGTADDFSGFIVELQKNYRSASAPEICRIADLLRRSSVEDAGKNAAEIAGANTPDFRCRNVDKKMLREIVQQQLRRKHGDFALAELPELCTFPDAGRVDDILLLMERCKFICAMNRGDFGTIAVNSMILEELAVQPAADGSLCPGTVLLINVNDKRSGLHNGDSAIVTLERGAYGTSRLCARFPAYPEKVIPVGDLPSYEYGFAITIHKAQGSGYDHVVLLMPEHPTELLSTELLYTGITRASKSVEVLASEEILRQSLARTVKHSSNLFYQRP